MPLVRLGHFGRREPEAMGLERKAWRSISSYSRVVELLICLDLLFVGQLELSGMSEILYNAKGVPLDS